MNILPYLPVLLCFVLFGNKTLRIQLKILACHFPIPFHSFYYRANLFNIFCYSFHTALIILQLIYIVIYSKVFFFFYKFIYLFIFGCVGSSFLCEGFLQFWQAGATLHRGARASHCRGLSHCGAQAPDAQAQ